MKPLSETYKELGIAFTFPIKIKNANGSFTYYENSDEFFERYEYDTAGIETYYENSNGFKRGAPKSARTCEGKVLEVDGIKYELKLI